MLWYGEYFAEFYLSFFGDYKLALLHCGTRNANVAIKTSQGITKRINISNIIMQGGVFGSLQCTTSIDSLAKEVYSRKELIYMYKGVAAIPPLLMVDDILTVSKCSPIANAMNATVNAFVETKKLRLNHKKCSVIHVGKKSYSCPELKVHGKIMHREESTKYLGDIYNSSGKAKFNINERSARAYAVLAEIRAILTDVPLGKYRTEVGLLLRQSMFVNGVLFNCEAWQGLNSTDITMLEKIDHQVMRVICNGHSKTAIEFLYLETAAIPLNQIVAYQRTMYLHNILHRNDEELVKRVYKAQRDNPTPGDFICLVKKDLEDMGEVFKEEDIMSKNKNQFKLHIGKQIKAAAFKILKALQLGHSKVNKIIYSQYKIQPYMTSPLFTNKMVETLFNFRCSMINNIKGNFSSLYRGNMECKLKCHQGEDIQSHLLDCSVIKGQLGETEQEKVKSVLYDHMYGTLEQQREVVLVLGRMLEIRDEILLRESLPVGIITGPKSIVTDVIVDLVK